jgi:hypothetical protein
MTNDYSNALKKLRDSTSEFKKSFANRLFDHSWSYFFESEIENSSPVKIADSPNETTIEEPKTVTEKVKVLDELHRFGEEQFLKTKTDSIKLEGGGELIKKSSNAVWEPEILDLEELKQFAFNQSSTLAREKFENEDNQLDILFLCDEDIIKNPNLETVDHPKLAVFYEAEVASLFQRMINAMKLDSKKYSISQVIDDESLDRVLNEIYLRNPKYVVSLGGAISSQILKTRDRLQSLRGRFHPFKITRNDEYKSFELLPLFSPSYLNEAPNSKRLAWEDMQKLMEKLA